MIKGEGCLGITIVLAIAAIVIGGFVGLISGVAHFVAGLFA